MKYLIAAMFTLISLFINAQSGITKQISGIVKDKDTGIPLEAATITLKDIDGKRILASAIADSSGNFIVHTNSAGKMIIEIQDIGHNSYNDSIFLGKHISAISSGTIYLQSSVKSLETVQVVAKSPTITNRIDKMIYNPANDVTSQGQTVIDLLRKVPQVNVDADGNVELQGNSNIRFLINGKPSGIFGNSLTEALSSIPVSQIKSIEVITSPGAKYDAQGTGGVINIVLKDNKTKGVNGSIDFSAGTRAENGSMNFNFRDANFGINAFFDGNARLRAKTPYFQDRSSLDTLTGTQTKLYQDGYDNFSRFGYQAGTSVDWDLTKYDNITASFTYSRFQKHNTGFATQDLQTSDINGSNIAASKSFNNSDSRTKVGSFDWSIGYTRKFKKEKRQLDLLYSATSSAPTNSYIQSQTFNDKIPYAGTSSYNPGKDRQSIFSIDYTTPLKKDFTLDLGAKATLQQINNHTDVMTYSPFANSYLPDSSQSYVMNYNMQVYATYVSATFSLFHYLDVIAGTRYEYTQTTIDYPNTTIPSYNTIVPSIILAHKINDLQTVKLAYTRRIERPEYREINPFVDFSDPYNVTTGNPALKPEIGNNLEFGYAKSFDRGGNIYIAAVERINTQDIKNYTTFYPSYTIGDSVYQNVSVISRKNTGSEYNTGLVVTSSLPFGSFNIRENAMLFNRHINANMDNIPIINSLNCRINLNASYEFSHHLVAEAFGDYRSSFKSIQGRQPGQFVYSFAFRKVFDAKKMSLGFSMTNPFNKYIGQVTTIESGNYNSYYSRQLPLQSFGVSFSYKFGSLDTKENKHRKELDNGADIGG